MIDGGGRRPPLQFRVHQKVFGGFYASVFYGGPANTWLGGLDAGGTVHYIGQFYDDPAFDRKVREFTTLDLMVNYTFNFSAAATESTPAGYAKDGGKNTAKDKAQVVPRTGANCGWRACLEGSFSGAGPTSPQPSAKRA